MRASPTPTPLTALALLVIFVGQSGALVTFQTLHVAHSAFPKLFFRNRNNENERYTLNGAKHPNLRRGTTTPPTPLLDAEPRHLLLNTSQSWRLPYFNLPEIQFHLRLQNGINYAMMKNMAISQSTMLSLTTALALIITTFVGGTFLDSLNWIAGTAAERDASTSTLHGQILLGAVTAFPIIFLSQKVDQAPSIRDANQAHFATTNMVLTLFGRRRQDNGEDSLETTSTIEVILSSYVLGAMTSLTEETIFRGFIPAAIVGITHSMILAWLVQAIVFGISHVHPQPQEGEN